MTAMIPDDAKKTVRAAGVPLRRYGDPEEVAEMVLSLALPAVSFRHRREHPGRRWPDGHERLEGA